MPIPDPQNEEKTDQSNGTNGEHPPRFAVGLPIPWFARQKIIEHDTLLDLRYLCRGGGMLIVAPSGQGKSTLSIQLAILWSCGREAFGITCKRPMRILIIQAEDDQGDCTEMSEMLFQFGLDPDELQMVEDNTELIRCNDLTNSQFAEALEAKLEECKNAHAKIDLVIINPYSTYLGEDVQNSRANIHFLNELINPILSHFEVGLVVIHHTPKTNFVDFDKMKLWDWQYAGAGSFALTGWARAILVVVPQTEGIFMFVAAKRGKRLLGWDSITRYFKHSEPGKPLQWLDVTDQERDAILNAKKKKPGSKVNPSIDEIITQCVSLVDWLSEQRIYDIAQEKFGKGNCGVRKVHGALMQGVAEDSVDRREVKRSIGKALPEYIRLN